MPDTNLPDPKAADFNDKVVNLLKQLFNTQESHTKDYKPIATPQEGLQVGSTWIDSTTGKLMVNTAAGVKTVQFEP